ncbi:proton-conducting transporter membrane subunit [Lacibacterium aquatile]|uniref:Proton-conducting transporter membrane subunit n=1 Tax=Lacibacterium aquatile TaxID=1168082 RepID=A0ABW5DMX8_9PROT
MLIPVLLLIAGLILCAPLVGSRRYGRKLAALLVCGIAVAALLHLIRFGGLGDTLTVTAGPLASLIHLRIDGLSALFLLVITLPAAPILWFADASARRGAEPTATGPLLILFVAALCAVPLADDTLTLLFAWEAMALTSWLLLIATPRGAEAGKLYLAMAILSGLALVIGIGLPPAYGFLAPAAILIGCMAKAGIAPLHLWLPPAHAEAPSAASALMSAVMTKMAIYVIARLWLAGGQPPPWGWGLTLAVFGAVSAVLALVQALGERDIKRLLARSTLDNLGLIALALGLAVSFKATGQQALAGIAFTGAIIHVFAHGAMKALAFCGAGALVQLIGSRDLTHTGGLATRARKLCGLLLISGFGLAAVPPFAGFAGLWLILQALLAVPTGAPTLLRLAAPLLIAAVGIAGGLSLAVLVRGIGLTLFGRPRSPAAEAAKDPPVDVCLALAALAVLSVLVGLLPGILLMIIEPGLRQIAPPPSASLLGGLLLSNGAGYSPLPVLAAFIALFVALQWLLKRKSAGQRVAPTWLGGHPDHPLEAQPSPDGLAEPLLRITGPLLSRKAQLEDASLTVSQIEPMAPLIQRAKGWLAKAMEATDWLQRLSERAALATVLAVLAVLLTIVAALA